MHGISTADRKAWDEVVRRFHRLVLHTAIRIGLNPSDAADVAQITWIRLLEHAHQIRNPDKLASWLVSTTKRESIRVARAARKYVPCDDLAAKYGQGVVADVYPVEGDYGPAVEQALSRLPTDYQKLLRLLTSSYDLTYSDISRQMNIPIGSIGPMRKRALHMLENTPEFKCGAFS